MCSTTTANSSSSKRQRLADRQRYAVDIGAGSATFCIEFLEANPTGLALAIDIIAPEVFWSRIPTHLRSRLKYHRAESTDWLDKVLLEVILSIYYPDIVYSDVTDIHFSPECQTLSEAGNTGARDSTRQSGRIRTESSMAPHLLQRLTRLVQMIDFAKM